LERLRRDPTGVRLDEYKRAVPTLVATARQILAEDGADRLAALPVDQAFDELSDAIE
jgi:hypothetical protein